MIVDDLGVPHAIEDPVHVLGLNQVRHERVPVVVMSGVLVVEDW